MPSYKLTYFNGRGRAEVARYLFAKAGVEYEDVRIERADFPQMKESLPFGQLPILEVDGKVISQSYAVIRFLAKRFGLCGKNEFEETRVDEVALGMEDMVQPMVKMFHEKDEERKAEMKKKYVEETLPNYVKYFERLLEQNNGGNGFFVGDSMTAADLCFYHYMSFTAIGNIEVNMDNAPKLSALLKRVEADEKIAAWIKKRPVTQM